MWVLQNSNLDLWVADQWYALQGNHWAWRKSWVNYDLIHHHGKQVIIGFGVAVISLIVASYFDHKLKYWRAPMIYLISVMTLVPAAIATLKKHNTANCPWDVLRYGGTEQYLPTLDHQFGLVEAGQCFPAGHASGGFALLGIYFAGLLFVQKPARLLLPGLLLGSVFALGQESRGAHFLSHDIWTVTICWFSALGLFLLFRPGRWPTALNRKESTALSSAARQT